MSDELKPCPFCKSGAHTFHGWLWHVACNDCGCKLTGFATEAEAIAAWNTRADDAPEQPVDNAQADSREKLEADVYQAAEKMEEFTHGEKFINTNKILRWLDRQAAITERELCAKCEWPSLAAQPDKEAYDRIAELIAERDGALEKGGRLFDKCLELTAERNELKAEIAKYEHDCGLLFDEKHKLTAERDELRAEVDRLQVVVRTQAESFKGIEAELAKSESACNTLRASVAGLKGTVERQRDELAEARHAAMGVWRALDGLFLSDGAVTKALVDEWRRKLAGAGIEAS